jgi:hypothetical protein
MQLTKVRRNILPGQTHALLVLYLKRGIAEVISLSANGYQGLFPQW